MALVLQSAGMCLILALAARRVINMATAPGQKATPAPTGLITGLVFMNPNMTSVTRIRSAPIRQRNMIRGWCNAGKVPAAIAKTAALACYCPTVVAYLSFLR